MCADIIDAYNDRVWHAACEVEARNAGLIRRRVVVERSRRRLGHSTAARRRGRAPRTVLIAEPARTDRELTEVDAAFEVVLVPRPVG